MKAVWAGLLLMGLAGCSDAGQVSGVYVQKQDKSLLFVQIVKTADGKVTGRGEAIDVMSDGSLKDESFPLEGSADGSQISLKLNVSLAIGPSFSGFVSGNTLTLVGSNGTRVLRRSTLEDFTNQKSGLAGVAKATMAANQKAKNAGDQQTYLAALADEGTKLDNDLPQAYPLMDQNVDAILANLQIRHGVITGNIKKLKAKWLVTPPDDKGSVEGDIQSQEGDMQTLAGDYDSRVSDIRALYDQLQSGLTEFKDRCDKATSLGYAPLPPQCAKADAYMAQYKTSRSTTKAKFDTAGAAMFSPRNP